MTTTTTTEINTMTQDQTNALAYALADLCGSLQAYRSGTSSHHDWDSHQQSIWDLAKAFGLGSEVPADCFE